MWSIFGVKLNYVVIFEKSCNSSTLLMELLMICGQNPYNPNTFAGLVGKVWKNYLPKEEGREGGEKKRAQHARWTRGFRCL